MNNGKTVTKYQWVALGWVVRYTWPGIIQVPLDNHVRGTTSCQIVSPYSINVFHSIRKDSGYNSFPIIDLATVVS